MCPILSPFGLRTAVPSTRSLAISWCGLAITSVIITLLWVDERNQRSAREGVPSGRQRFPIRLGIIEEGHRLKPVAACPALPEIGHAARTGFEPVRGGDRLAALGAGIFVGQIAGVYTGHGATPFLLFAVGRRIGQVC